MSENILLPPVKDPGFFSRQLNFSSTPSGVVLTDGEGTVVHADNTGTLVQIKRNDATGQDTYRVIQKGYAYTNQTLADFIINDYTFESYKREWEKQTPLEQREVLGVSAAGTDDPHLRENLLIDQRKWLVENTNYEQLAVPPALRDTLIRVGYSQPQEQDITPQEHEKGRKSYVERVRAHQSSTDKSLSA